jgi:hypothetical protein
MRGTGPPTAKQAWHRLVPDPERYGIRFHCCRSFGRTSAHHIVDYGIAISKPAEIASDDEIPVERFSAVNRNAMEHQIRAPLRDGMRPGEPDDPASRSTQTSAADKRPVMLGVDYLADRHRVVDYATTTTQNYHSLRHCLGDCRERSGVTWDDIADDEYPRTAPEIAAGDLCGICRRRDGKSSNCNRQSAQNHLPHPQHCAPAD